MKHIWIFRLLLVGLLAFITISVLQHPLATNDGPVHVAFAHLISSYQQPGQTLQSAAYSVHLRPDPNLGVYVVMAQLLKVLSPALTESIIQLLCLLGPVAAGYFAIYMVNPRNVWLSIFLLPLTLNQMFFLGLYNHSISIAAFLLVIGTCFWLNKAPSYFRSVVLASSLVLAFLCHASGFLIAFLSLAAMTATLAVLSFSRTRQLIPVLIAQRYAALAMVLPLPLGAVFLASGEKGVTSYGITLPYRIRQFAELHLLSANYPAWDRFSAALISGLLFIAFAVVAFRILVKRIDMPQALRNQAIAAMIATLTCMVFMFAFPDVGGGGWTHFRRFEVFPFFWMLLVIAFGNFSPAVSTTFTTAGAFASVLLITSMTVRQRMVREQMGPLAEVDALVGAHCTVLPVVFQAFLMDRDGNPDWMDYEPFYQSASRLELRDDRVVLFNYLARLAAYPVHFRPGVEPQANIFHWEPEHIPNDVETIDIPGFESSSGMRVDYILLWGVLDRRPSDMFAQVHNATRSFESIYKSADSNVELFRRIGTHNPACSVEQTTHAMAPSAEPRAQY